MRWPPTVALNLLLDKPMARTPCPPLMRAVTVFVRTGVSMWMPVAKTPSMRQYGSLMRILANHVSVITRPCVANARLALLCLRL